MHRATQGALARWQGLLSERGASAGDDGGNILTTPWRFGAAICEAFAEELGFATPPGLAADFAKIAAAMDQPGDCLAFTPSDCCPDNHYLRGERVVFFDCEGAQMRHALIDATYFLAPFPTCWCCAKLPGDLPQRLLAAYREGCPDTADFDGQLTMALAAWLPASFAMRAQVNWLEADQPWGLSTARQRVLELQRQLLARPGLSTLAPGFAEFVGEVEQRLSARWSDVAPMALYPAFQ
jgi:hypothetical protein